MIVEIDQNSGFCYGVVRAIRMAEKELQEGTPFYSLGDIVHNEQEVARLHALGMAPINHANLGSLHAARVMIRAHGEPPETYRLAQKQGLLITDATCPVVLHLQNIVHAAYRESLESGGQVVIYGKPGHAEVNGLVGQTENSAVVIESEADVSRLDVTKPVYLFSQTTNSIDGFRMVQQAIERRREELSVPAKVVFRANNTICRYVASREEKLSEFSRKYAVILFVSGMKSSNGKVLYEVCRKANPCAYRVSQPSEVRPEWILGFASVGVCGATSTPHWVMSQVAEKVKEISNS